MVGHLPLAQSIGVRVPVPQQFYLYAFCYTNFDMKTSLQLNKIQKFVVVETENETLLYGDTDAKFHKDIVQKLHDSGIIITKVKGGAKIKVEDKDIFVWDKSSVYGEVSFAEVSDILNKSFLDHKIINSEPPE
jgi:hypothetical protein